MHATGHKPNRSEIDVPINHGDDSFIEAFHRSQAGLAKKYPSSPGVSRSRVCGQRALSLSCQRHPRCAGRSEGGGPQVVA